MLLQLVLVGVYVLSIVVLVVRFLTRLEGCVQSKGESKSSFRQSLMFMMWFSQALSFCFMAMQAVSGFLQIWSTLADVGERQLGSCITLFLSAASQQAGETAFVRGFEFWNCFCSSGYGHVLGLRICASSEIFSASCFAEGSAMIDEFKLKIAEAVTLVTTAAAFSASLGLLRLVREFQALLGTRVLLARQPQPRHHGWTWRRARKQQLRVKTWLRVLRSFLAAWFKKHPNFFFDKRKEEREERKVREDGGDTVLLVRGLQENTMVVHCGSGWTARDLSDSLLVRTSVPVHLFYLVVEGRVIDGDELVRSLGRDRVVSM